MTHRIDGSDVEELLSAELDGELTPAEEAALREHLPTCAVCHARRLALRRSHTDLRRGAPSASALEAARAASLRRVSAAVRSAPRWSPFLRLASALAAVLVIASIAVLARSTLTSPSAGEPHTVVVREEQVLNAAITLTIEERPRLPGAPTLVIARADIRIGQPTPGSAQIRVREAGQAYGVLAEAPDLSSATSVRIEGAFPDTEDVRMYETWVHVERGGASFDTAPVAIEIRRVGPDQRGLVR